MAEAHERSGGPAAAEPGAHAHPTWKTYVLIGAILTVITAAEVAVFYIPALRPVLVPVLLVLSSVKFALVVMFYMHLKFDAKVFSAVFLAPLTLAVFVVVALVVLFHVLPLYGPGR
ncbi:MAG: cytochrome C oxidase subunit IV family protein [Gemmatimonadota bacterium]